MARFSAPAPFTTRPDLLGHVGMVASTHWLASASAMAVLERGGNAFDASVAAGFVLQVVEPHFNGPGGELVGLVAAAGDARPTVLAGAAPAPLRATLENVRALGLTCIPGAGPLSAPATGQFDAWMILLRDRGTWDLGEVLSFAIHYARKGFPVTSGLARTIASVGELFASRWPTSYEQWMPGGRAPAVGDVLTNGRLAYTYERVLVETSGAAGREARIEAARRTWSEGFVARALVSFNEIPHWHPEGGVQPGFLTFEDLAAYRATYEDPVSADFAGHTVWKAGAWTQGPALLQMLGILEGLEPHQNDPAGPEGAHLVVEAIKLAMADREGYFGDVDVPLAALLDIGYLRRRRDLITERAAVGFPPGAVEGYTPYQPPLRVAGGADHGATGEPTVRRNGSTRGDTCHLDVVDRWGNMASITPSGGWLQSSPYIPELGFALSSRLQQTWLDPRSPAALHPGRRPRLTLSPTLVTRDGEPVLALGTPGGDGQDQWQLLYLLRTLVGGWTPQQAIDAPALVSTAFPDSFWPRTWVPGGVTVEPRLGEGVIASLTDRGHVVTRADDWTLGRLSAVTRDPSTGLLGAAANPRGAQGYAVGR